MRSERVQERDREGGGESLGQSLGERGERWGGGGRVSERI